MVLLAAIDSADRCSALVIDNQIYNEVAGPDDFFTEECIE